MLSPDQWNELVPVGTPVRYWNVKSHDLLCFVGETHVDTKTRSVAWSAGCGHTIVKVDGIAGGVSVDFLAVRAALLADALRALWLECVIIGDQCGQAPGSKLKAQCERALGEELSEDLPF